MKYYLSDLLIVYDVRLLVVALAGAYVASVVLFLAVLFGVRDV